MTDSQQPAPQPSSQKRTSKSKLKLSTVFSTTTFRRFPFTYLHLTLISLSSLTIKPVSATQPIDLLTFRAHLTSALTQFLGTTGAAIPLDIIKAEGRDVWLRVPFEDGMAVTEALSGWVGSDVAWRIRESGCWLGGMVGASGRDLFES